MSSLSFAPLYVALALALLVAGLAAFVRLAGGRYAERLIARGLRVPTLRRLAVRSYVQDLETTNPVATRALEKVERVSGSRARAPGEATLSSARKSDAPYLGLFAGQAPQPLNRAQRRQLAKQNATAVRRVKSGGDPRSWPAAKAAMSATSPASFS
jgi:hypothetical protein